MFCPHFSYCRLFVFHSVPGLLFFIFHYKTLQCSSDLGMLMYSRTMKPSMQKNQSPWDLSFLSLGQLLQPRWWLRWWRVCLQCPRPGVDPPVQEDLLEKEVQPTSVFLPGESRKQRNPVGCSPRGRKDSDRTECLSLSLFFLFMGLRSQRWRKAGERAERACALGLTCLRHPLRGLCINDHLRGPPRPAVHPLLTLYLKPISLKTWDFGWEGN